MQKSATISIIAMLTLISTLYVYEVVIAPHLAERITFETDTLSGQMEPPYQYRFLQPFVAHILEKSLELFDSDVYYQHIVSHVAITFTAIFGSFLFLYLYLRHYFSHTVSMIGMILLQTIIPLSVSGFYMEGDFIALGLYAFGLYLMVKNKDIYLPVVFGLATLNREQSIFLAFWYGLYIISHPEERRKKVAILFACVVVWVLAMAGTRLYFGLKPSIYTVALHIAHNTDPNALATRILPLWVAEVIPVIALCILAFSKSNLFFRLSFLSLSLYTLLFFLNGNMWELAKYLPAFLIMIPIALQAISGEYVEQGHLPQ